MDKVTEGLRHCAGAGCLGCPYYNGSTDWDIIECTAELAHDVLQKYVKEDEEDD